MTDLGPGSRGGAHGTDSAFGFHYETHEQDYERRARNLFVHAAVLFALTVLALLATGLAVWVMLQAINNTL